MEKIIRKNIFETNSSSSHSLIVTKIDDIDIINLNNIDLDENGKFIIGDYESCYNRSPDAPLFHFQDKLKYLVAAYQDNQNAMRELEDIAIKVIPGCTGFVYNYVDGWGDTFYGYVDGESREMVKKFFNTHNVSFEDFLLNKKYVIILDGDEYNIWETLKECHLINLDNIIEEN